ncbi:MAG: sugar porter family MFS transporter [Planctomycetota bacterium]|jgi:MFS family permease
MKLNSFLLKSTIVAALGGFLFGFDTIVISGAEKAFQNLWQLGGFTHGLAMSMALWGTVIGAVFGGIPASRYGRKKTLVTIGVLYFVSAVFSGIAPNVIFFMVARFIGGLGVGASTVAAPMFISEISPPGSRGKLSGMFQFNIVFGILIAFLSNFIIDKYLAAPIAWRWMMGIEAIPALLYTVLSFTLPESPRWLITHAKEYEKGADIFRKINPESTEEEIEALVNEVRETVSDEKKTARFWTMRLKVPILLAFLIALFNQFSGINIILYFAPRLLGLAGMENALAASAALGLTNLIFTFVGLWLIDKLGRRSLLYIGSFGYILSLGICAIVFMTTPVFKTFSSAENMISTAGNVQAVKNETRYFSEKDKEKVANDYAISKKTLEKATVIESFQGDPVVIAEDADTDTVIQIATSVKKQATDSLGLKSMLVLICLLAFIAAHAIGQGTVIWVFISEIFPNDHRAAGQALGSSTHWLCAAGLTFLFPIAIEFFEPGILFAFFCFMMVLQLVWVKTMVPETKGISLEKIQKKLGIE